MNDEEREYLNEMIRSLNNRLVDALRERDEARRLFCKCHAQAEAAGYAEGRGWDCFKEGGNE